MAKSPLAFRLVASTIGGYDGKQPLKNTGDQLTRTPQYRSLFPQILDDFTLSEKLRLLEAGELSEGEMDIVIDDLSSRLKALHPVLPILVGDVLLENPEEHLPVSFKLNSPKLKELNDAYHEIGADELMVLIQNLVLDVFNEGEIGIPPVSMLSREPKGGKLILNLNSPKFRGLSKDEALSRFKEKEIVFLQALNHLIEDFDKSHGGKLQKPIDGQMLFGVVEAWDFMEGETQPTTKDCVRSLLLSEHVANLAKLRSAPEFDRRQGRQEGERRRSDVMAITGRQYLGFLEDYLRRTYPDFLELYRRHVDDPAWEGVFQTLGGGGDPFLSLGALQAFRKHRLKEEFPVIDENEYLAIKKFVDVVNTIDVLKPFLGKDVDAFCERLERIAKLIKTKPVDKEAKKNHIAALAEQMRVNLKDRVRDGAPLAHTRFAFCERLHGVLCMDQNMRPNALYSGDIAGFGAANIFSLLMDIRDLYDKLIPEDEPGSSVGTGQSYIVADVVRGNSADEIDSLMPSVLPALKDLLETAGDHVTEIRREFDERVQRAFESDVINDADGGDELVGVAPNDHFEDSVRHLMSSNDLRMVVADLSGLAAQNLNIESAAHLVTCLLVFAGGLMRPIKRAEALNKRMAKNPVNVTIRH